MTKTKVGAETKDTGLIVDKLYTSLVKLLEWVGPKSDPDIQEGHKVLEEYRSIYGNKDYVPYQKSKVSTTSEPTTDQS